VLLRRLQKAVKIGSSVAELYAGVGLIGLSLATTRKCRTVKCVEVNKEARLSFEQSLSRLPASVNSNISWHCADASVSPINWLEGANVVIVDPPRKGLDPTVIEALRTASLRGLGKTKSPSSKTTDKVEKRPWMLRAKQGAVHKESASNWEEEEHTWPDTLIYVSCGWQAFKLV
jgi:16S rRNA G966 N2-methylase RsmD